MHVYNPDVQFYRVGPELPAKQTEVGCFFFIILNRLISLLPENDSGDDALDVFFPATVFAGTLQHPPKSQTVQYSAGIV